MKKRLLSFVMILCMILLPLYAFPITVNAYTGSYNNGTLYYNITNGSVTITDCVESASGTLDIPATIGGYPVTSIGYETFYNCINLTSITIPNSVKSIGNYAFSGCRSLKSITIPDSVVSIGYDVFESCNSLNSVHITNIAAWCNISFGGISSNPLCYANNLYLNGELVTNLVIPNGVTSIGYAAFYNCSSLTNITMPDSVTSIGNYAFSGCTSITSIIIPDSVTNIGISAFRNCTSLTSISIPDSVINIGYYVFDYCNSLNSVHITDIAAWCNNSFTDISSNPLRYANNLYLNGELLTTLIIPDGVTSIGDYAFSGCNSLTSVIIPDSVMSIGNYAFFNCSGLISITIPNSVTSIGNYAFDNCNSLTSISIPESVTSIGEKAFYCCDNLTDIYYSGTIEEYNKINIHSSSYIDCSRIHCTNGEVNNTTEEDFTFVNGVIIKYIGSQKGVYIPETINGKTVTAIADNAFNGSSVYFVVIPDTVKTIGNYAFSWSSMRFIEIPNSVTTIGDHAFYFCSLKRITIPDSVTSIGNVAFSGCHNLTSISIPDSVTSIGGNAFEDCSNLKSISIPDGVTSIGGYAFSRCNSLQNITLPNIKYIGSTTFKNCYMLEKIVIPKTVKSIGADAFYGCYSLDEICYEGTKEEWQKISIASGNDCLNSATIVYDYVESKCNIYYDTNGSNDIIDTVEATVGDTIKVSNIVPHREHYKFIGWTTNELSQVPEYLPNDEFTATKSVTLYAIWEAVPYITAKYKRYDGYKLIFATLNNMPDSAVIYFAEYKDGILISMEKRGYTSNNEMFASFENADKYVIFAWNSDMMPLCTACEIEID